MTNGISSNSQINLQRLGLNQQHRAVYSLSNAGQETKISIPQKDIVKFETSLETMNKELPNLINTQQKLSTPEGKRNLKIKIVSLMAALPLAMSIGTGIIAYKKGVSKLKTSLIAIGTGLLSIIGGSIVAKNLIVPKSANRIQEAYKNLSEIDVQPER